MTSPAVLPSLSAPMNGGFTAIHDVGEAMSTAGAADLLISTYRTRAPDAGRRLTGGGLLTSTIVLPDAIGTIAKKSEVVGLDR